ncbi:MULTISPECIES: hypothetical protein [Sphingobium]|uniref:hypothetical protein n=1 Tax=Sphingobium TaxID=165695 RepID=UPI00159C0E60|nr:hypothetical protein [Sphingobium sp. 15-1]
MENSQAIEAANLIASLYRGELTLERLPESCRPKSIADAQQILNALSRSLDRPVQGYKCYFPFKATQPNLFAPIFNILPSGSAITPDVANLHLIEPEILFRAERDLPPREEPYSYEEVASAVVAVPAFEFLATRFSADFASLLGQKDPQIYADNTLSGGFVVGEADPNWRALDFLKMRIVTTFDGKIVSDETGGHPVKDPFILIFVGVNLLRSLHGVKKGQLLATLSPTGLLTAEKGVEIVAEFEGFGRVETRYAF